MNIIQRIAKNTFVIILSNVVTAIINFFFTMYIARYLGADGFGVLSFALAFTAIFSVFTDIGLSTLTTREVARDRALARKYLGNLAVLKVVLAIAVFGVIALVINLMGYPQPTITVVYLIGLSVVLTAFSKMFYSVFQACERMEFIAVAELLGNVLLLGGALFAIRQGSSINAFAWLYFLASAATLTSNVIVSIWKFARPKLEIDFRFWKETLRQALPFGMVGVFTSIYYWIDSVMLSRMQGDEAVGWYSAAYRLFWVLSFIVSAYYSSVFPVMSRFYVSSRESLRFVYGKSLKYMIILAVPLGVGTTLLADKIIMAVFGAGYSKSVIALQILIWSMSFTFVSAGIAHLFNSLNRQTVVTRVTGGCALLNVALNLLLIPKYSYIGAGIARVTVEFGVMAVLFALSRQTGYGISGRKTMNTIAKALIASGVMAVFILYLPGLALWWLVPLSVGVYFVVLFIIRGIDADDKSLAKQLLGGQRVQKESGIGKAVRRG